jgi:hypothetical protein
MPHFFTIHAHAERPEIIARELDLESRYFSIGNAVFQGAQALPGPLTWAVLRS